MEIQVTPTGIPGIGALSWGTHVCQFYEGREDLADYLVPYFKTGLEHDEYCLWVTADPLSVEEAQTLLRAAVPDLDTRAGRGQIEFVDYRTWYLDGSRLDPDRAPAGWREREQSALPRGYAGGRVSGNAFWLESSWRSFADYEARLNESSAGAPDVLPVRREAPESLRCPRKPLNSLPPKNMKCLSATSLLLMLLRLRLGVIRSRAQPQYNGEELLLAVEPRRVKRA